MPLYFHNWLRKSWDVIKMMKNYYSEVWLLVEFNDKDIYDVLISDHDMMLILFKNVLMIFKRLSCFSLADNQMIVYFHVVSYQTQFEQLLMWPVLMYLSFSRLSCCSFEDCKLTTEWLLSRTRHRPKIAIVCGSGLGLLADSVSNKQIIRYEDIPNFPVSTGTGFMEVYQSWVNGTVYNFLSCSFLSFERNNPHSNATQYILVAICSNKEKDEVVDVMLIYIVWSFQSACWVYKMPLDKGVVGGNLKAQRFSFCPSLYCMVNKLCPAPGNMSYKMNNYCLWIKYYDWSKNSP